MQTKVVYETLNGWVEVPGLRCELVPALLPRSGDIIEHQGNRYHVIRWHFKATKGPVEEIHIQTEKLP